MPTETANIPGQKARHNNFGVLIGQFLPIAKMIKLLVQPKAFSQGLGDVQKDWMDHAISFVEVSQDLVLYNPAKLDVLGMFAILWLLNGS